MTPIWCPACGRLTTMDDARKIALHRTDDTVCGQSGRIAEIPGAAWGHTHYIEWLRERVAALRVVPR